MSGWDVNTNMNISLLLLHHYNSTTSGDAQLYWMFHKSGPTPVLILPALLLSIIGLIGIPLNAGIVYTTIKYRKTLNRNDNYLIAMNAFFDRLQLTHPFPFLFIALSGTNFISTFLSLRLILPSLFGIQCSSTGITCTGIDRLLSVVFPIRYHEMNKRERQLYCGFHTLLCVANGIWNAVGLWLKCAVEADKPVTRFIGQIGWDSGNDFPHYLVGPILIWMTNFCYLATGVLVFLKKRHLGSTDSTRISQQQKLLKSLVVIVIVHVGTSLFGSILLGFFFLHSTIMTWYAMTLSLCIVLLGPCSNAIVLYKNSSEYRLLFNNGLDELKTAGMRAIGSMNQAVTTLRTFATVGSLPTILSRTQTRNGGTEC